MIYGIGKQASIGRTASDVQKAIPANSKTTRTASMRLQRNGKYLQTRQIRRTGSALFEINPDLAILAPHPEHSMGQVWLLSFLTSDG